MSSSSDLRAEPVSTASGGRSALLARVAAEWGLIADTLAELGSLLSRDPAIALPVQSIVALQGFDILGQQIRTLSELTVHLARAAQTGHETGTSSLDLLQAIPVASMRQRLLEGMVELGHPPRGPDPEISWF